MTESNTIDQAIQALRAGDNALAQKLLTQALQADPKDDQAWYWMAACVSDGERKRYCLEKALALQPENALARQALDELDEAAAGIAPSAMDAVEATLPDEIGTTPPEEGGPAPAEEQGLSPSDESVLAQVNEPVPVSLTGEEATPLDEIGPMPSAPRPEGGEASAKEDHDEAAIPPPRKAAKAAARRSNGMSPGQAGCLIALALILVIILTALAVIASQNETLEGLRSSAAVYLPWLVLPTSPMQAEAPVAQLPLATLALPPTWTPAPSPSPVATLPPPSVVVAPALPSPSPYASITPFFGEWRIVIGRSVKNNPIEVYRFGTGNQERMIIAGIHGGDEANTVDLADQLIAYLHDHPQVIPQGVTLYILRSLNPDGEASGERLNANGIDLNRNFETGWKASWKDKGCSSPSGSAGKIPGSEPEVQAVMKFLGSRQVQALINYHSAGLGIFPAGNPPHPASATLAQAIADVSDYPYPPVKTGCEYTGTLVDWAVAHGVSAAVDLELNDKTSTEFETNLKILLLLLKWEAPVEPPTPTSQTPTGVVSPAPASPAPTRTP